MGKLPRFYVPLQTMQNRISEKRIPLPLSVIRHAVRTLRLKPGDQLILFDGQGIDYVARLLREGKQGHCAEIVSTTPALPLPKPDLYLYHAPIKKERWEWLLEKATELAVFAIIPIRTKYMEMDLTKNFEKKMERWNAIVQSACEQCGRSVMPHLLPFLPFEEAVRNRKGKGILFYERSLGKPFRQVLETLGSPDSLSLFIGPEGGFSEEEAGFGQSGGLFLATLGKQILRAETAGVAALAMSRLWFSDQ